MCKVHFPVFHQSLDMFPKWCSLNTWNNPIMLEHPGPPLNHAAIGAVFELFRASKNQNHMFIPVPTTLMYPLYCLTFGVVSQTPEFVTNSSFAPVSKCSNTS